MKREDFKNVLNEEYLKTCNSIINSKFMFFIECNNCPFSESNSTDDRKCDDRNKYKQYFRDCGSDYDYQLRCRAYDFVDLYNSELRRLDNLKIIDKLMNDGDVE